MAEWYWWQICLSDQTANPLELVVPSMKLLPYYAPLSRPNLGSEHLDYYQLPRITVLQPITPSNPMWPHLYPICPMIADLWMSKRLMISDLYIRNVSEFCNQWDYTGSHENKHRQEIFSNAMGKPTVIADSATSHSSIAFDLYSVFYRKTYVFSLIYMYIYIGFILWC